MSTNTNIANEFLQDVLCGYLSKPSEEELDPVKQLPVFVRVELIQRRNDADISLTLNLARA